MKFDYRSLRPFAAIASGLLALVACQNATDSNSSNSGPMKAIATLPFSDTVRVPDSTAWSTTTDSGHGGLSCTGTTCHDTLSLKNPLGSQVANIQLWRLGIHLETLHFTQSGNNPTLIALDTFHIDSLGLKLLESFDSLRQINAKADSLAKVGPLASDLIAYYASLLLAGNTTFNGFPSALPAGLNPVVVQDTLVLLALQVGKTPVQIASLSLGLDTGSIRTIAGILVQANLLKTTDTLVWFHPVRVSGAVSVAGSLTAGGGAVGVSGSFSWNAGKIVSPKYEVHTTKGLDTNFTFSTSNLPSRSGTAWTLAGNLTVQATASASAGTDTLVVTLSSDSGDFATSRVPFQVVARDTMAPALKILSPIQDTTVPNATSFVVVSASASDSGSGIASVQIGSRPKRTAAPFSDTVYLASGIDTIVVQAWDNAGNHTADTVHVTRTPPTVVIAPPKVQRVSPSTDTTVGWGTKSIGLSWTVTDDSTFAVSVNGTVLTSKSALYQTTQNLATGLNTFVLLALDAHGTASYDTIRVTRQATSPPPVVARSSPGQDTVILESQPSLTASWKVTDPTLQSVTINGNPATLNGNVYSSSVSFIGDPRDSLWVTVVATDSSTTSTRDSIKVKRLAAPTIPAGNQALSSSQALPVTISSNLPGTRIGYSTDGVHWLSYPSGGVSVSQNEILYAQDTLGSVVSGVDSSVFLYVPNLVLSGSTATQSTVTITPGGVGVQDSLSTGGGWIGYSGPFPINGNTKVYARSRLGAVSTIPVEVDFAVAPTLIVSPVDTGVDSVIVTVVKTGADSVEYSIDQQASWHTLIGSTYPMIPGTLYARSRVGSAISSVSSVAVQLYLAPPKISPSSGTYLNPQMVNLSGTPAGAQTIYTTDGSVPSVSHGTLYSGQFLVGATQTIKTIAIKTGFGNSAVANARYALPDTNAYGIPWNPNVTYGTLLDVRDSQVYRTVKIGTQTWMAQNLNYADTAIGGACYNGSAANCSEYGILYSWQVQGICPDGWHLPSQAEWTKLTDTLLDSSTAGSQLMSSAGWGDFGGSGLDTYGFRVLPGGLGHRGPDEGLGSGAVFWSSTVTAPDPTDPGAWAVFFSSGQANTTASTNPEYARFSVRCLQN